jgi:branched-chain amino acid transport system permease protein
MRSFGPAILIVAAQQVFFPAPAGIVVRGLIVGGLTALIALGMALIYRANRILNFARADLGLVPVMVTYMLLTEAGLPYVVAVPIGLAVAVLLGATTERLVIRRFARAPRLLVTIATVGLSQVLVAAALLLPRPSRNISRSGSSRPGPTSSTPWRLRAPSTSASGSTPSASASCHRSPIPT